MAELHSELKDGGSQAAVLPDTWQGELRALLKLGAPMAFTQLAQFFVFTIDILMIGRLGPAALAASSLGAVLYFFLWMVGSGPVMAVSPLVSQALGANQEDRADARRSVRMSLWVIFLMSPLVLGLILLTEPICLLFGQDPEVSREAAKYVLALSIGWPFALGVMALRNFLAALGKTTLPFVLVLITTALNAGFNYLLIFGSFGFPEWGLVGAGVASSLSYACCFLLFILYIQYDADASRFDVFKRFWVSDWARFKDVIRLGWPISITTVFEGMLFNSAVLLMGLIGIMEVAAYQISINVVALAFMLPWGLSMAGAVRIGLAKGAKNVPAQKRAALTTLFAGTGAIGIVAIVVALFPTFIASLYLGTDNPENAVVLALVVTFLPIACMFMIFDALQVAANQLLRGLKDVNWPMLFTGISYWGIGFPLSFYLTTKTEVGALGVWYGLMAGLTAASIFLNARLWQLIWKDESPKR